LRRACIGPILARNKKQDAAVFLSETPPTSPTHEEETAVRLPEIGRRLAMITRRNFGKTGFAFAASGLAGASTGLRAAERGKETFEVTRTDEEWRRSLSPEAYNVLRRHGTERAGSSPLNKNHATGTYLCAGCAQALFSSETKFDSGTGWPSFYKPIDGAVSTSTDSSHFMTRTEVHCSRCGGHLGHVFDDGPAPTGLRYCMNGVAMRFETGE
jgi:peptide-methionine (R)-S-oxide reductase